MANSENGSFSQNNIDINIKSIYFFLKIVECGNLTRASEELYVSQPYLSKTMQSLEERLGFALFSRERNKLVLTTKGTEFYCSFKPILRMIQENIERIKNLDSPKINIGLDYTVDFLKLIEKGFISDEYGLEKISVEYGDFFSISKKLRDGNIDIFITLEDYSSLLTDVDIIPLGEIKSYIIVSSESEFSKCRSVSIGELYSKEITMFIEGDFTPEMAFLAMEGYCRKYGFNPNTFSFAENYQTALLGVFKDNKIVIGHELLPGFPINGLISVPFSDKTSRIIAVVPKKLSSEKRAIAERIYNKKE